MKTLLSIVFVSTLFLRCSTTLTKSVNFNSLKSYSFEQVEKMMVNEPRNIAVFLHANWCKYCKNMEQTTFKNERVIQVLKDDYYFISFDGEQKESVSFQGKQFDYIPSGRYYGTHEIATSLGTIEGQLTYPAFIVINAKNEIIFQYASFIDASTLIPTLEKLMEAEQ